MRDIRTVQKQIRQSPKVQELRRKKRSKRKKLLLLVLSLVLLFIGGIIALLHVKRFHIQNITIVGNQILQSEDITEVVRNNISGSYLLVIPKRNTAIYPKKQIIEDIYTTFPRIEEVSVKRDGLQALTITVSEKAGDALYCGTYPSTTCYFTSSIGRIVDAAPTFSGSVYLRFFTEEPLSDPLGTQLLETRKYTQLISFVDGLESLGFRIYGIVLGDQYEHEIVLTTGGKILFQEVEDYSYMLANLQAALEQEELQEKWTNRKKYLEYFDLRFSNKVYYKFNG